VSLRSSACVAEELGVCRRRSRRRQEAQRVSLAESACVTEKGEGGVQGEALHGDAHTCSAASTAALTAAHTCGAAEWRLKPRGDCK
jgi:hypothetical protein